MVEPQKNPESNAVSILLVDGGDESGRALKKALESTGLLSVVESIADGDSALEALVDGRFDVCFIRSHESRPDTAAKICADAKEAGLRTPIIVLVDIASASRERSYIDAGAMAAIPWDGSEDSEVRNILRMSVTMSKAEESLRRSNNRLVQDLVTLQDARERAEQQNIRFVELAEQYALAKDELEKLNQEKNRFFSIIAHDLRSPFTSLLGYTTLIDQMHADLSPHELKRYAGHINDAANRVFKLLENLLEWARLQMGSTEAAPVQLSVGVIAARTAELLGPVAAEKNITLNIMTGDSGAFADANQVDAIIRNLVNNAIKFTPEGGAITVSARVDGETTTVSVSDTGIGISDEKAARLFTLAENVSTEGTAGERGTGLGLLLCKELVRRNGGDITVSSQPGRGSRFAFTLPARGAGSVPGGAQPPRPDDAPAPPVSVPRAATGK